MRGLFLVVLMVGGCKAFDPNLLNDQPIGGVGAAGTAPVIGPPPAGTMEAPPPAGTAAPPPAGAGGMGGVEDPPPPPPGDPECGGSLQCVGGICTDPGTMAPPTCSTGNDCGEGTACAGGSCIKPCGEQVMAPCPSPLVCTDLFGNFVCTQPGEMFPPACTMGGTECDEWGFTCSNAAMMDACWFACQP